MILNCLKIKKNTVHPEFSPNAMWLKFKGKGGRKEIADLIGVETLYQCHDHYLNHLTIL